MVRHGKQHSSSIEKHRQWSKAFDRKAVRQGEKYYENGRVYLLQANRFAPTAVAEVYDGHVVYNVVITIDKQAEQAAFVQGQCSCRKRHHCEHVYATLLELYPNRFEFRCSTVLEQSALGIEFATEQQPFTNGLDTAAKQQKLALRLLMLILGSAAAVR